MKNQVKRCTFPHAWALFWKRYVDFRGTSRRSEFWFWKLWRLIVNAGFWMLLAFLFSADLVSVAKHPQYSWFSVGGALMLLIGAGVIWFLATIIPTWALKIRRFNDAGLQLGYSVTLLIVSIAISGMCMMTGNAGGLHTLFIALQIAVWLMQFVLEVLPTGELKK